MSAVAAVARSWRPDLHRATVPIGALAAWPPPIRACCSPPVRTARSAAAPSSSSSRRPHLIGGVTAEAGHQAAELFALLAPVVCVADAETAEAIKLFATSNVTPCSRWPTSSP